MGVNGIYGLSGSGLDVDSMVKVGMMKKQTEYDKMQQKYTQNEWKKAEMLELYGELQTFANSTLSQYKMSNSMNARGASSSNESSVGATANSTAALMTHYVKVNSLASNVYLIGTKMERENEEDVSAKNQLSSLLFESITKDTEGKIVINGDTKNKYNANDTAILFSIDDGVNEALTNSNTDAVTVTTNVDDSVAGNYTLNIDSVAQAATINTTISGVNSSTTVMNMFQIWTGMDAATITNYFSNAQTAASNQTAVALSIGDGTNTANIEYTYEEIYNYISDTTTAMSKFIEDFNSELESASVTAKLEISDKGKFSLTNTATETGFNSSLVISFDTDKVNNAVTGRASYEADIEVATTTTYNAAVGVFVSNRIGYYTGNDATAIQDAYTAAKNAYSEAKKDNKTDNEAKTAAQAAAAEVYKTAGHGDDWVKVYSDDKDVADDIVKAFNIANDIIKGNTLEGYTNDIDNRAIDVASTAYGTVSDTLTNKASVLHASDSKFDSFASKLLEGLLNTENNLTTTVIDGTDDNPNMREIIIRGEDATGTITDADGNERTLSFADNTAKFNGMIITAKKEASNIKISNPGSSSIAITYGELLNGYSLNDLSSKINSNSKNVHATYDAVQDRFSIYNKESGQKNQLNISLTGSFNVDSDGTKTFTQTAENTAKLFNAFGLQKTANGNLMEEITFKTGETRNLTGNLGEAYIDGVKYDLDSNKITVNGVNYNFLNTTSDNVTVSITQDTSGIVEKVKSFVSDYNALLTKLYEWYDEKPNSDYKPLTAKQKESMKEEQIEKWEKKAKAGLLYHDSTLGKIIDELRTSIFDNVTGIKGEYNNIFSLGISTSGTKGQLTLDEEKLNAALAEDPDAVYNIFAKLDKGETQYLVMRGEQLWVGAQDKKDNDTYIKDEKGVIQTKIVKDVTQYLVIRDGKQIWTSQKETNDVDVLDDNGNLQTKTADELQYLIMRNPKQVWTTTLQADDVQVKDSDGNPRTKTTERTSYNGIAQRLGDVFTTSLKSVKNVSGTSADITEDSELNDLMRELQTKMSNFKRMMDAFEKQLYKKYDAMESSLALLGAQLNYVTSAFQS